MYLFFPIFRLNLSFLSQIQDDAKAEFTALKGSLEPADNGIPVKKHHLNSCAYSKVNWVQ